MSGVWASAQDLLKEAKPLSCCSSKCSRLCPSDASAILSLTEHIGKASLYHETLL